MEERIASLFASATPVCSPTGAERPEEPSGFCIVPVSFQLIEALLHDLPHAAILDSLGNSGFPRRFPPNQLVHPRRPCVVSSHLRCRPWARNDVT